MPGHWGTIEEISLADALEAVKMVRRDMNHLKRLADEMYWAAQYLNTDDPRLQKALEEYHQFIIHLKE